MKMPLVIDHSLIHSFKCWHEGVQVGCSYGSELYIRHCVFSATERLKAYAIAWEKSGQNINVFVSVSSHDYTIWLSLRSLNNDNEKLSGYKLPRSNTSEDNRPVFQKDLRAVTA